MSKKNIEKLKSILRFHTHLKDVKMKVTLKVPIPAESTEQYEPSDIYFGLTTKRNGKDLCALNPESLKFDLASKYSSIKYGEYLEKIEKSLPVFFFTIDFTTMNGGDFHIFTLPEDVAMAIFVAVRSGQGPKAQYRATEIWSGESLSDFAKRFWQNKKIQNNDIQIVPLHLRDTLSVGIMRRKEQ